MAAEPGTPMSIIHSICPVATSSAQPRTSRPSMSPISSRIHIMASPPTPAKLRLSTVGESRKYVTPCNVYRDPVTNPCCCSSPAPAASVSRHLFKPGYCPRSRQHILSEGGTYAGVSGGRGGTQSSHSALPCAILACPNRETRTGLGGWGQLRL